MACTLSATTPRPSRPVATRDVSKYADYLHGQVEELLTQFGRIDLLWFDFSYPQRAWGGKGRDDWRSEELLAGPASCNRM